MHLDLAATNQKKKCVPAGCRRQLDKCTESDAQVTINTGCVLFKEGKYDAAAAKFKEAVGLDDSKVRAALRHRPQWGRGCVRGNMHGKQLMP